MAMNDEQRLHSGWRATADIGYNPTPDSVTLLGSFQTITEFWRLFNNLGQEQALDMLPSVVNFRMFRASIASKYAVNERSYAAGSWDIGLTSKGSSLSDKFMKLCLLVCCELLGTDVNAVILRRCMTEIKVSIWCEIEGGKSITDNLGKYFTNDDILTIGYYSHGNGEQMLASARKSAVNDFKKPVTLYNFTDAFNCKHNKGSGVMPADLHSVQWSELQRESILYQQQQQRVQCNVVPGSGPPGLKKPTQLRFGPSQTQIENEHKNKMRPIQPARKGKQDQILAKQIQRIMANIRNLYDNYYQVTFTQDLELKLRNILNEEKCPLSVTGYDREESMDCDEGADSGQYDNSLGFAILKCRLLNCQHVIRLAAAKQVVSNTFRTFHDSEFKPISFKSLKSLAFAAGNGHNIRPKRRFKIELKFFHLLSDVCADNMYIPEQVQSVTDDQKSSEYILLYYDHKLSPYKSSTSYHYVNNAQESTYLRFVRGRVIANLQDLNSKSKYQMNFSYDLSKSSTASVLKQNESNWNGGILLEHIEPNTNSSYKFYLQKEPVSNLQSQTGAVYYRYKLVAIRFDFVVKQSTPTLSPTFGVVNNANTDSQTQPPLPVPIPVPIPVPVPPQTATPIMPMPPPSHSTTAQIIAQAVRTLSPQQPPQAQPQQISPMHIAKMVSNTPTGPQPVNVHQHPQQQILPTTPSQNAVITVTTPTALQAINPSQYAQYQLVNSPQIQHQSAPIANPNNPHQYQANINVASLTAPSSLHANTLPTFPMSPGGSIGLTAAANLNNPQPQSQMLNTNVYAQGPPPSSSPMLHTNTANIQSILGQTQMMQPPVSSSVSNSLSGAMGGMSNPAMGGMNSMNASAMHPYSPMVDPNVGSTSMTYGNALNSSNPSTMISSLGLSNPVSPGMSQMSNMSNMGNMGNMNNMSNMTNAHLGYGMSHTPGGTLMAHTSPGMTYVQANAYPPMSPATQSINSSLSSLDPQAQQFALMSGSQGMSNNMNSINSMGGYMGGGGGGGGVNSMQSMSTISQHNQMGLGRGQMIGGLNQMSNVGLMGMNQANMSMNQGGGGGGQMGNMNNMNNMNMNQMRAKNQNQGNIVTVVNKQQRSTYGGGGGMGGYSGGGGGGGGGDQMNNNRNSNQNRGNRGYGGGQMNNRNKKNQQTRQNYQQQNRQQYQRKIRDKQQQNKRLHDARTKQNFMGRGYHHQMPLSQQRKMRTNFMSTDSQQSNMQSNYGQSNSNNSGGQGRGGRGNSNNSNSGGSGGGGGGGAGSSAFGFPVNANPIPQVQLNNNNAANAKGSNNPNEANDDDDNKLLSLNALSPQSDGVTPTAQSNATPGSAALAGVMSPKTPTMIDHVVDRVYFIAKTQSGSRFVQEKLSDKQYFGLFFKELKCHVAELMVDNFGHYAIEALFSHCDDHQRLILAANLSNHMPQVACHKQGSFSIQAMMDTLSTAEQIKYLVDALNRDIKKIILNHSGHYVILRFLQRYDYPYSKFIHKALMQHTLDLATDHYGLRVMKASVDAGPIQEMSAVFASIVKHANTLVENQYGNYIIQHLLDLGPKEVTDTIKEKMHGKFVRYSKQKFSSNVVEKCLRHSTNELKQNIHTKDWTTIIVRELLTKAGDLISDKYGNYCLQTALQAATDHPCLLQEFEKSTKPHLDTLRENVKAKWVKLLESAIEKQKKRNQMPGNMPSAQMGQQRNAPMNQQRNPQQNQMQNRQNMQNNNNRNNRGGNKNNGNHQQNNMPQQQQQNQMNLQQNMQNLQQNMQNMQVQQQQQQMQ